MSPSERSSATRAVLSGPGVAGSSGAAPAPRKADPGQRRVAARKLGAPRPAVVRVGADGLPVAVAVGGRRVRSGQPRPAPTMVDSVREDWVVEDRWWVRPPLRRRYFELVLVDGRNVVVFHDLVDGGWFEQRS